MKTHSTFFLTDFPFLEVQQSNSISLPLTNSLLTTGGGKQVNYYTKRLKICKSTRQWTEKQFNSHSISFHSFFDGKTMISFIFLLLGLLTLSYVQSNDNSIPSITTLNVQHFRHRRSSDSKSADASSADCMERVLKTYWNKDTTTLVKSMAAENCRYKA